jgi:hypothetical protein
MPRKSKKHIKKREEPSVESNVIDHSLIIKGGAVVGCLCFRKENKVGFCVMNELLPETEFFKRMKGGESVDRARIIIQRGQLELLWDMVDAVFKTVESLEGRGLMVEKWRQLYG